MKLPQLDVDDRSREFNDYTQEQRESVVVAYLFKGYSYRDLERYVLRINFEGKGWQAFGILRHYGFTPAFKGKFKKMEYREVLDNFPEDKQYDFIYDIIERFFESDSKNEYHDCMIDTDSYGISKKAVTKIRVNQDKFRNKILKAYNGTCCITGISEPHMLIASHIKPWCVSTSAEKLDVKNGLCLNALHDNAFDSGLITVDSETYCIKLSDEIEKHMPLQIYENYFSCYDGETISMPKQNCEPDRGYLKYHNTHIFQRDTLIRKVTFESID